MVESIKNTISRLEPRKANNNHAVPQSANKSAETTSATDSVKLKSAENMATIKDLLFSAN